MSRPIRYSFLILLPVAVASAACSRVQPSHPGSLVVEPYELNLGTQYETLAFRHKFHIRNTSNSQIQVERLESTCDCLKLSPQNSFIIEAGGRQEVEVTLALKMNSPCQRSQGVDQAIAIPVIAHIAKVGQYRWNLTATAKPAIRIVSGSTNLGLHSVERAMITSEIIVELSPEVHSVECSRSDIWSFSIPKILDNPEHRYTARLEVKRPLKIGSLNEILTLTPMNRSGDRLPDTRLQLAGEIAEDVLVEPRQLCFGSRKIGTDGDEIFSIRSLSGRTLLIKPQISAGSEISELASRNNGTRVFQLRQFFKNSGDQSAKITFEVKGSDSEQQRFLEISVTYFGRD